MNAGARSSGALAWWCAGIALGVALVRMVTIASGGLPYWFTDPWAGLSLEATVTPMGSLLLDSMVWLAAAGMIWHEHRRGRRAAGWSLCAILAGAVVVGLHGFVVRSPEAAPDGVRGHFGSLVLGSAWVSAMLGVWTISVAARERAIRDAVVAVVAGSVVLFAMKAALNVTVEHGALAADYRSDPAGYLAENGIEPGTPGAAVFERRMNEPQATGWIALSNAFGTMVAAMSLGLGVVVLCAWRDRESGGVRVNQIAGVAVLLAMGCAALVLSRSKGAGASMALAAGLLVLIGVGRKRALRRWLVVGVVAATLAPLGVVVARGVAGDTIGERSLLFRWQYLVGAARVAAEHPVFGVGAEGFKSAYLQVRSADAVEEVSSPHSVMFDWIAGLGVVGIGWCAVWFGWIARGVRNVVGAGDARAETAAGESVSGDVFTLGVVVFAGLMSLWSEWAVLTEAMAGAHLIGFLVWIAAARGVRLVVARLTGSGAAMVGLAMALVVGVHAHMEVTATIVGSAGLALAMLGAAGSSHELPTRGGRSKAAVWMAGVVGAGGLLIGGYSLMTVRGWEVMLRRSAVWIASGGTPSVGIEMADLAAGRMATSEAAMGARVRTRLAYASMMASRTGGYDAGLLISDGGCVDAAERFTARWPGSGAAWELRARTEELVLRTGAGGREWADRALVSWERAGALDPRGIGPVYERWRLLVERVGGDRTPETVDLAGWLIEMDARIKRMDPVRGLSAVERDRVGAWLVGGGGGG